MRDVNTAGGANRHHSPVRAGVLLLALAGLACGANAAVLPQGDGRLERASEAFVAAAGFLTVDVDSLSNAAWYSAQRFRAQPPTAVRQPDADLDALTKAMLMVEAREPALDRARYRISYSLLADAEVPENALAVVEVTRFNLAPAMRRQLIENYGAENVGKPAAEQRVAHVSWRFVSRANQGQRADIVAAARREWSDTAAARMDCLGHPCLGLDSSHAERAGFKLLTTPKLSRAAYQDRWLAEGADAQDSIASPVRVVEELFAYATLEGHDPTTLLDTDKPQFLLLVSLNDGAQEDNSKGLLRQAELMDDAIAELQISRNEWPGTVEWRQLTLPRAGRQ